jgi:hypothetical protein
MTAGMFGAAGTAKYRCKAAHEKRRHAGGYVMASLVEQFAFDWLIEKQVLVRAALVEHEAQQPALSLVKDPTSKLNREISAILGQIDALGQRAIELDMPKDSYQRQLAPKQERLAALKSELLRAQVKQNRPADVIVIPDLIERWDDLTIPERREILRAYIEYIEVTPGRSRATFRIRPR